MNQHYLKMTNIEQGSQEWLQARQNKIGGSEIFSLVIHYCKKELEAMNFDLKEEKSFRSVQEMFMKLCLGAKMPLIDPMNSQFGNGMEEYVAHRLQEALPEIDVQRSKSFLDGKDLHELAACSPDGYIYIKDNHKLHDFDNTCEIDSSWGEGMLELKTANFFANFGAENGSKLSYIFQTQYNMMIRKNKWGLLAVLVSKEKSCDDAFLKGQILEKARNNKYDEINEYYDFYYYIYPELPAFQAMIIKSLKLFHEDVERYLAGDQSAFPRNSEDLKALEREKIMWGQVWPEHFGERQLDEEDELNKLLEERNIAKEENMFAEQAFRKIENEILSLIKQRGYDKFIKIHGFGHRVQFQSNGIRFYKNKK
jgi:hypothetical protein